MSIEKGTWKDRRRAESEQSSPSHGSDQRRAPLCPYCGESPLLDGRCARCGTICSRCGTPYADYCPVCYGEGVAERVQAAMGGAAAPTPYGDTAPSRSDLSRILGHSATVREHNIARGIHVDVVAKAIHDKASAAVGQLDVSPELRARILERVETEALAIRRRGKKEKENDDDSSGRNGRVSLEKAVAFAFLRQCRGIGRSMEEMQHALARAGFGIRLEPVYITVATRDPANLRLFVNGCERRVRIAASPKLVRVPIYLSDILEKESGGGRSAAAPEDGGEVEIRVGGDGSIIDVRSPYEFSQTDWHAVKVFAGRRCFYLFKAEKEVAVWPESTAGRGAVATFPPLSVNAEAMMKRFLPSRFPVSAMLMSTAGCLREVELRFASLFREMIRDAHGRAPESVAADALYLADQDVFASLPDAEKNRAQSVIIRMGLARGSYAGKRGLLLKREVGFDEKVDRDERGRKEVKRGEGDDDDGGGRP